MVSAAFEDDRLNLALSGGEDYELLFTARGEVIDRVKVLMPCPVTAIGEIVEEEPGKVRLFDEHGREVKLEKGGWEHFRPKER
jgi:thiamine-monophosphate kinase